jgi:hypothetical protein
MRRQFSLREFTWRDFAWVDSTLLSFTSTYLRWIPLTLRSITWPELMSLDRTRDDCTVAEFTRVHVTDLALVYFTWLPQGPEIWPRVSGGTWELEPGSLLNVAHEGENDRLELAQSDICPEIISDCTTRREGLEVKPAQLLLDGACLRPPSVPIGRVLPVSHCRGTNSRKQNSTSWNGTSGISRNPHINNQVLAFQSIVTQRR